MKEELKQKMIGVIGTHSNTLIESIAEKCAQIAVDHYKERHQALSMSGVSFPSLPKSRCCGRCNGIDDICVADMICKEHDKQGCEICYGARDGS